MTFRSEEERGMEDAWERFERRQRLVTRLVIGAALALSLFLLLRLVALHSEGGTYDAWGEALRSAQREVRP